MKFLINGVEDDGKGGLRTVSIVYDNETSALTREDGSAIEVNPVAPQDFAGRMPAFQFSPENPARKGPKVNRLKIQLGFMCNYSCGYCSQKFVPRGESNNVERAKEFVANVEQNITEAPSTVEFWGGEPLVYWKLLKPIAEALRVKWPLTRFIIITNGSLLTNEIAEWLDNTGFAVAISHDGPGQVVRGADPFDDPAKRDAIFGLVRRLAPQGRISFNSVLNKGNLSRAAIQDWLVEKFGEDTWFMIGEGGLAMAFDKDGTAATELSPEERVAFRLTAYEEAMNGKVTRFGIVRDRVTEWINSFGNHRPRGVLSQACSMANPDTLAVDLRGNVITCQNVTAVAKTGEGRSHRIGHLSALDEVRLDTGRHWSQRPNCADCPVVQLCRGACLFLTGDEFARTCRNAYDEHIPLLAAAIKIATGITPVMVFAADGSLPTDRVLLWQTPEADA